MKALIVIMLLVGMVGCGKTLTELRTDGDAIVHNGAVTATQAVDIGASVAKKVFGAVVAVYDIVMKVLEDTKDNVVTVKDVAVSTVTGTEPVPTK